ncbi:MAG: nitronate monooxygenase [Deltaproteobacteria bacterium]|nr:nitronate monooxygenase [Deltaproteobacteria bacterium]
MATSTPGVLDRLPTPLPVFQAPMAGAQDEALAIAVGRAGGLGALPCAMLSVDAIRAQVAAFRAAVRAPIHLNFFAHHPETPSEASLAAWRARLRPYYLERGLDPEAVSAGASRAPFDAHLCALVEELRPEVVSFHFGLPSAELVARVRGTGAVVMSSATSVTEARALEAGGVDVVIAQGLEAGGHRGSFLTNDTSKQPGTFALVPQIVDAVRVLVVAAGGIADARGVAAALALGACAVQIGTAYLRSDEARISPPHRDALARATDDATQITNVMTGRAARGFVNRVMREHGPMRDDLPPFPHAATVLAPLRAAAERGGSGDFSPMWAGQAASLARTGSAYDITRELARGRRTG